jgi:hypothetical protein
MKVNTERHVIGITRIVAILIKRRKDVQTQTQRCANAIILVRCKLLSKSETGNPSTIYN